MFSSCEMQSASVAQLRVGPCIHHRHAVCWNARTRGCAKVARRRWFDMAISVALAYTCDNVCTRTVSWGAVQEFPVKISEPRSHPAASLVRHGRTQLLRSALSGMSEVSDRFAVAAFRCKNGDSWKNSQTWPRQRNEMKWSLPASGTQSGGEGKPDLRRRLCVLTRPNSGVLTAWHGVSAEPSATANY